MQLRNKEHRLFGEFRHKKKPESFAVLLLGSEGQIYRRIKELP